MRSVLLALPILIAVASLPAAQRPAAASADDGGHHRRPAVRNHRGEGAAILDAAPRGDRRHAGGAAAPVARRRSRFVNEDKLERRRSAEHTARRAPRSSGWTRATMLGNHALLATPTPTRLTAEAYLADDRQEATPSRAS